MWFSWAVASMPNEGCTNEAWAMSMPFSTIRAASACHSQLSTSRFHPGSSYSGKSGSGKRSASGASPRNTQIMP